MEIKNQTLYRKRVYMAISIQRFCEKRIIGANTINFCLFITDIDSVGYKHNMDIKFQHVQL